MLSILKKINDEEYFSERVDKTSACTEWLRYSTRSVSGGKSTLQPIGERQNIASQDSDVITETGLDRWRNFVVLDPLDRDGLVSSLKLLPEFFRRGR